MPTPISTDLNSKPRTTQARAAATSLRQRATATRHRAWLGLLTVLLILVVMLALSKGAVEISLSQLFAIIFQTAASANMVVLENILFEIRLPRVCMAMLCGASLALAGACLQGLFRNPLADPGLVGVTSGAALGAALMIVLGARLSADVINLLGGYALPIAAFIGAMCVTLIIFGIAGRSGKIIIATLLLAGIAINALAGVCIGVLTYISDDAELRSLTFWSMGSLGGMTHGILAIVIGPVLVSSLIMLMLAKQLNLFQLGEDGARHLGVNTQKLKFVLMAAVALAVGSCVAFTGIIGFVGLVVPHLIRLLIGPDHRVVVPGSALLGAALLTLSDLIARTSIAPAEIPIGLMTSAIGAPFFLWMLIKQQKSFYQ